MAEEDNGRPTFAKLRAEQSEHQIEAVGAQLREMMAWTKPPTAISEK
ncbi:MAG: hypothetical protein ACRDPW_05195 [Mycobacteriales bacterium]